MSHQIFFSLSILVNGTSSYQSSMIIVLHLLFTPLFNFEYFFCKILLKCAYFSSRFLSALVVILGEYDLLSDLERLKPEIRRVKRMIVHRNYNPQNFDNDIALLELDPPVIFRPHISPICLPEPTDDFTGRMAYVTGWGKTAHGKFLLLNASLTS